MKKAINAINQIDNMVDLNEAIAALKAKQKSLRASIVAAKKAVFSTGQTVNISSKKGRLTGTIVKLNRTKAVVEIDGRQYNCPISIMEVA
jgi:glutamate 5-kinase